MIMLLNKETIDTINNAVHSVNSPQDIKKINDLSLFMVMILNNEIGGDYNKALAVIFKLLSYYLNEITTFNNIIKQNKVN